MSQRPVLGPPMGGVPRGGESSWGEDKVRHMGLRALEEVHGEGSGRCEVSLLHCQLRCPRPPPTHTCTPFAL